ncbi:hypothetical protein ACFLUP_02915 [Chloroflexota bacterium]
MDTVSHSTSWDYTNPKTRTSVVDIIYQRVGDRLFWVTPRDVLVFNYDEEENVWVRNPSVMDFASSSSPGKVFKSVHVQVRTLTFDEDGITLTTPEIDRYLLIETSVPGEYHWKGSSHISVVATGPLGKPVKGN